MEYRRLGSAGVQVSEVALGSWMTFGDKVDVEMTRECIKVAIDQGINFLDTADSYAAGAAESALGKAVKDLGLRRQDLVISSKVFKAVSKNINDRGLSRKHIKESIQKTLQNLATDYIDIYYCHRFDPSTPLEELVQTMNDLIHQGQILYWGTSVWTAVQLEAVHRTAERLNMVPPVVEQPRYHMLDRHIEPEILPVCRRNGMGVTPWSPLAQGMLTGKYNDGVPEDSRGGRTSWLDETNTPENREKAKCLSALAGDLGIEMAQLALAWILRCPEISSVLIGATKSEQIVSNAGASGVKLSQDVVAQIETILDNDPMVSWRTTYPFHTNQWPT